MALFLFLLFAYPGLLLWGIQFLFFLLLLISHRELLLLVQGHQMRDLPPIPRNRGEQKLQNEYVLDSRIHSRPDSLWNFRNLQKHSRRGLVMIFSKITRS
ncbi:hypothetical protein I3842_Q009000 [Carya illinoinensis]|uniref:Uncharacterized protein n=1 Tax=Carya illinoinensis TaxID=32201 RepID=A0A922A6L6_CARIL|nr:hypothetical protein I3842_Q009000 [Carya illinoinensis]